MASVTLTIPDDIKAEMKRLSWINWSELAKEKFSEKQRMLQRFEKVEEVLSKSKLTQEDADKLSDEANLSLAKRYEKLLKSKRS